MQFKKHLPLVIVLLTVFLPFSCITVDKSLGEDYIPGDQNVKIKQVEFDLPLYPKNEDSLQAYSTTQGVIGVVKTEDFGTIEFASVGNITQPKLEFRFGKDPILKSVYLNLSVSSTSVFQDGQDGIPQNITVYRTLEPLDTTKIYCNSYNESMLESNPLNSANSVYFGDDSIKVFLDKKFGEELLKATNEELDSVELFTKRFKGLYVKSSAPETAAGGRLNYFTSAYSSLVMVYSFQPEWSTGLERKDTTVYFGYGSSYVVSPSTYSKNLETTEMLDIIPIQGIAGAKPFISAKKLKSLISEWATQNDIDTKNIIIAKASYHLPFEYPADLVMSNYPGYLFPTLRDTVTVSAISTLAKKNYVLIDDVYTSGNSLGVMNRSLKEYSGDFSSYLQTLINKDDSDIDSTQDIWFAPISSAEDSYGNVYYNTDTQYYNFGYINGPKSERKPKIKILYTVLK